MYSYISVMNNHAELGRNIKLYRKHKGWTQTELAQRLGCSQAMITTYERGQKKPSTDKIRDLAQILDVSIDQLFGTTQRTAPKPKNIRLWRKFEKLQELPSSEKRMVFKMIDGRKRATKVWCQYTYRTWAGGHMVQFFEG